MDTVLASPPFPLRPDLGVGGDRPSHSITRERPKIDRIAGPWLVLRLIDPTTLAQRAKT